VAAITALPAAAPVSRPSNPVWSELLSMSLVWLDPLAQPPAIPRTSLGQRYPAD
jgi:hypothetical protein